MRGCEGEVEEGEVGEGGERGRDGRREAGQERQ